MHLALPSPPVLFAVLFALCSAVAAAKIPGIPRSSDGSEDTDHGAILSGQDVRALSDGHANVFTLGNAAAEVDVSPDAGINIPIDAETIADDTKHPKRKRNVGSGGSGRGPGSGRPGQDGSADPSSVRYAPLLRNFDFSGLVSRERYIDYLVMVEALLQETMAALGMTPGQRLYCSPMVMFFVKLEEATQTLPQMPAHERLKTGDVTAQERRALAEVTIVLVDRINQFLARGPPSSQERVRAFLDERIF